jgi:hypothetical protein
MLRICLKQETTGTKISSSVCFSVILCDRHELMKGEELQ